MAETQPDRADAWRLRLTRDGPDAAAPLMRQHPELSATVRGSGRQFDTVLRPNLTDPQLLECTREGLDFALILVDLPPTTADQPAAAVADWITAPSANHRGLLPRTDQPTIRVLRIESAKLLITSDPSVRAAAIATSKTGQPVEIRLLADPAPLAAGADLPLRVYVDGSGFADAHVTARHTASGTMQSFQTDRGGIGHFRLTHDGEWSLVFHAWRTADPEDDAQLRWYTATFSFHVRGGGA